MYDVKSGGWSTLPGIRFPVSDISYVGSISMAVNEGKVYVIWGLGFLIELDLQG